jgi:import receptor subunit TOM22
MVKVEIVEEKDQQDNGSSPYGSPSSSRTSSSASLSSVSSELSHDETFYDRITALVDIVPPTTRHSISSRFSKATSFIKRGGKLAGNIVWIVTTSALLVGLPLALSLEDEAKIVAQEQEMLAQQQGAQQVGRYMEAKNLLSSGLISLSARCSVAKGPCIRRRPARTHKGRRPLCLLDFDSTNKFFTSPHLLTNYLVHRRRTVFTLICHVLLRSIHDNHLFQLQMVCVMAVEAVPVSYNCLYMVSESTRFDE